MGLDITAARRVTYVGLPPDEASYDTWYEKHDLYAWVNTDFPERAGSREKGFYDAEETFDFRAGSYSGYNHWREWLSETMLGVAPKVVWDNHDRYCPEPFYELICFADNEGIIGPEACTRLLKAFRENQEKAGSELAALAGAPCA